MSITKLNARSASALDATILTGNLPAISGASLTGITTGKILQVIEDGDTGYAESTSTTYDDTGAQVAITPSATSSKIWVQYIAPAWSKSNDGYNIFLQLLVDVGGAGYNVVRIMTQMNASGTYSVSGGSGTIHNGANFAFSELLSPSTTSELTYKVQWKLNGSSTMWKNNYNATASQARGSLVVMEVGA